MKAPAKQNELYCLEHQKHQAKKKYSCESNCHLAKSLPSHLLLYFNKPHF